MKRLGFLFAIALAFLFVMPLAVFAEEETTATEDNNEVTLYFFRGEGCSHCAEFEAWLDEIEPEYGNLFEVKDYETWYNTDNADLMKKVAEARDEEANGVPYIIIGNKSWNGFADDYKDEIIAEIKNVYDTEPAKRYDIMKLLKSDKSDDDSTAKDVVALLIILFVAALIVFGVVKTRKVAK